MPKLTIELDADILEDLKAIAKKDTITANQYVADLIELEVKYQRGATSGWNPLPSQKKGEDDGNYQVDKQHRANAERDTVGAGNPA
jgi:hypothetical protein